MAITKRQRRKVKKLLSNTMPVPELKDSALHPPEQKGGLVIYCSRCQMWFDTKNGWHAKSAASGIPLCPACGTVLFEIESSKFYETNRERGQERFDEVMTWEWPDGSFWQEKAGG